MLLSEFIERTNFYPSAEEFERINNDYMESDLDKDAFCARWKRRELRNASARMANEIVRLNQKLESYNKYVVLSEEEYRSLRSQITDLVSEVTAANLRLKNFKESIKSIIED